MIRAIVRWIKGTCPECGETIRVAGCEPRQFWLCDGCGWRSRS